MNGMDIKIPIVLVAICFSIGGIIDYFTKFHWLTAGLMVLAIFLINGLIISVEDRKKDGFDYDEEESQESKESFRKACLIHTSFILLVVVCAIISASR